jgi:hypothetical protein
MRPTKRQARAIRELYDVTAELDAARAVSLERARRGRRGRHRRARVERSRVFD